LTFTISPDLAEVGDVLLEDDFHRITPRHVRHEREMPGPLDRRRELALVARAVAGDAARHDLSALGDERAEELRVLVVDADRLVGAEAAGTAAAAALGSRGHG
jgi:hypothetical protein